MCLSATYMYMYMYRYMYIVSQQLPITCSSGLKLAKLHAELHALIVGGQKLATCMISIAWLQVVDISCTYTRTLGKEIF